MKRVTYFTSWSKYGRKYNFEDLPLDCLTHLSLAFGKVHSDSSVVIDEELKDFRSFRKLNFCPALKWGLVIGGWGNEEAFSKALDFPESLVESCLCLQSQHHFDYLEFDWEYPKSPADGSKLLRFLRKLRSSVSCEIYLDIPCSPSGYFPIRDLIPLIDCFMVMGYDLFGPWSEKSGHHCALYPHISDFVMTLLSEVKEGKMIVLTCPAYGRSFLGCSKIDSNFDGAGIGSFDEQGVIDYGHVVNQVAPEFDEANVAEHAMLNGSFVTFEGKASIGKKIEFILQNNLGGIGLWHAAADSKIAGKSLLHEISAKLLNQ